MEPLRIWRGLPIEAPAGLGDRALRGLKEDLQALPPGAAELLGKAHFRIRVFPEGQAIPGAPTALGRTDGESRVVYLREEALPNPTGATGRLRIPLHELGHALDKAFLDAALMASLLGPAGIALSRHHFEFTRANYQAACSNLPVDKLSGGVNLAAAERLAAQGKPLLLTPHSAESRGEHVADCAEAFLTGEPEAPLGPEERLQEAAINRSRGDLARFNPPMTEHFESLCGFLATLEAREADR